MTILDAQKTGLNKLKNSHIEVEILLSNAISKDRAFLFTHPEKRLTKNQIKKFNSSVKRRIKSEPIAYIINKKEFYGRPFFIDKRVHIPRPETEDMIDEIKKQIPKNFSGTIVDIGTGSGCIGITLALELGKAKIIATDISKKAIEVAKKNAKSLGAKNIKFALGNLFDPIKKLKNKIDIIASNPPYGWEDGWTRDKEIFFQPKISYLAKEKGMEAIKKIIEKSSEYLSRDGLAFIEFDPRQTKTMLKSIPKELTAQIIKDSQKRERIIILKRRK